MKGSPRRRKRRGWTEHAFFNLSNECFRQMDGPGQMKERARPKRTTPHAREAAHRKAFLPLLCRAPSPTIQGSRSARHIHRDEPDGLSCLLLTHAYSLPYLFPSLPASTTATKKKRRMGDYDAYGVPAPVTEAPPRPSSPGQSEEVRVFVRVGVGGRVLSFCSSVVRPTPISVVH